VTHQGAPCDAASVHFGPTIRRTDTLAMNVADPDIGSDMLLASAQVDLLFMT